MHAVRETREEAFAEGNASVTSSSISLVIDPGVASIFLFSSVIDDQPPEWLRSEDKSAFRVQNRSEIKTLSDLQRPPQTGKFQTDLSYSMTLK
jgi:hypothetical protein